ncbi:MAG: beta-lactamase family protein [Chloroflexi bacterium]|nr:beta-lactamase family protein [Chloroflexota bacterium]
MDEIPSKTYFFGAEAKGIEGRLNEIVMQAIRAGAAPCVSIYASRLHTFSVHGHWGWQNPETHIPLDDGMLFDLASVTKLFTVTAFLRQVSEGKTTLDSPLADIVPEFAAISPRAVVDSYEPQSRVVIPMPPEYAGKQVDPASVTFRQLLTHTSGLPPWRRTYELAAATAPPPPHLPDPAARELRWARVLGALCALDFVGVPGDRVRYTDIGLMLLGEAVARMDGRGLAEAIRATLRPSLIEQITYRPVASGIRYENVVPTEFDAEWRKRRAWGEVHDENACGAGGIAGHAGLFGTAIDIANFGTYWLRQSKVFGVAPELMREAVREQVTSDGLRRGLGWVLKAAEGANCGDLFSADSYGHTGFTGTSLWIDPQRQLVVAMMTNRVYAGRDTTVSGIYELRRAVHTLIAEAVPISA